MKKLLMTLLLVAGVAAFAGVEQPFVQFTQSDFCQTYDQPHNTRPDQNWFGAQMITLDVSANSDVWLSNYVRSWYEPIPDLHGNVYNMSANMYGYIFADDINGLSVDNYEDAIHWSNGQTTDITYFYDDNPNITNTATGYFLGHFNEDAEIYLVMTTIPDDGGETVDSYQYVQDDDHVTTLYSRQHNTYDLAGNVRINFGIDNGVYGDGVGIGREFVAVYDHPTGIDDGHGTTGGPLPGVFFAGLLSLGTVFGASKMKRQKRA